MKRIELEGTRVETLWTTVESGKDSSREKYEKVQRTAPRTFENAVQDENGVLLSTKLRGIQEQLDGVSTDIENTIETAITERAEKDIATKEEVKSVSEIASKFGTVKNLGKNYVMNCLDFTAVGLYGVETFSTDDEKNYPSMMLYGKFSAGDFIILNTSNAYNDYMNGCLYMRSPRLPGVIFTGHFWGGVWQGWSVIPTTDTVVGENLLINPDFKINQRGKTEYNENYIYTVDRWKLGGGGINGKVIVNDGYITLTKTKAGLFFGFYQPIVENLEKLSGENLKLSAKVRTNKTFSFFDVNVNGDNYTSDSFPGNGDWNIVTMNLYLPEDVTSLSVGITLNDMVLDNYCDIAWIKLERGSVVTPFIPPDPATELLKCQRYFRKFAGYQEVSQYSSELLVCYMMSYEGMRTIPTCKFSSNEKETEVGYGIVNQLGNLQTGFEFSISTNDFFKRIRVDCKKANHGLNSATASLRLTTLAEMWADSEIY